MVQLRLNGKTHEQDIAYPEYSSPDLTHKARATEEFILNSGN